MELFSLIVGSAAVGVAVGILSGLLGIGGGTVLVPVFKLLYGMPAIAATATSLFTIIPTSLSGVVTHVRNKTCIPALGVAAGIGGAIMSPLGVWLASASPDWAIMAAAAAVIAYSAATMFRKALKLRKAQGVERQAEGDAPSGTQVQSRPEEGAGPSADEPYAAKAALPEASLPPARRLALVGFCVGLVAGVVSGYVGVGGGFLMIPMFMQLLKTPMKLTSGTSLIAVMILAIPGTIAQALLGNVDWVAGIMVAIGTIPGAAIGSKLIVRVPELVLRFVFSAFLLVAAALLVLNQLGVF